MKTIYLKEEHLKHKKNSQIKQFKNQLENAQKTRMDISLKRTYR
jgi:hypothetical protein